MVAITITATRAKPHSRFCPQPSVGAVETEDEGRYQECRADDLDPAVHLLAAPSANAPAPRGEASGTRSARRPLRPPGCEARDRYGRQPPPPPFGRCMEARRVDVEADSDPRGAIQSHAGAKPELTQHSSLLGDPAGRHIPVKASAPTPRAARRARARRDRGQRQPHHQDPEVAYAGAGRALQRRATLSRSSGHPLSTRGEPAAPSPSIGRTGWR